LVDARELWQAEQQHNHKAGQHSVERQKLVCICVHASTGWIIRLRPDVSLLLLRWRQHRMRRPIQAQLAC
jgi:hypothetical protein